MYEKLALLAMFVFGMCVGIAINIITNWLPELTIQLGGRTVEDE